MASWKGSLSLLALVLLALFLALPAPLVAADEATASATSFSLPEEELEKLRGSAETFHFQAEVNRMMTLIINSLYRNKEIFLRELISNASDALDKIRFLALTNIKLLAGNPDLNIKIQADPEKKLLHIADSGIGMTKEDLIKNLGTIAKSGTSDFLKKFEEKGGDLNQIGQFGVGFYSVFLVADRVTVTTKHNDDKQYIWESTAESDFAIFEDPRGDTLGRGTVITLHLKPEAADFLKEDTLRSLVKKYSEFINFPIYLHTTKTETVEVPVDEADEADEATKEGGEEEDVEDVDEDTEGVDGEDAKPKTRTVTTTRAEFEVVNDAKPIWLRSPGEVEPEEYTSFYQAFFKAPHDEPLGHVHFKAEGEVEFRSILFIPPSAPSNLYSNDPVNDIKLFVRRVFITDTDTEPLLPSYLRFLKGVVDSDDLPLNVSRETLQQSKLLRVIKKKLTKKALDMLKDLAEGDDKEKYEKFYKEYSASLKLGVIDDASNRKRLAKLLRFHSSESPDQLLSFDDYVERFKKGQDSIYFLAGSSVAELQDSPFLERLTARGYEVLFLHDPIDEYTFQSLTDYDGKTLVNAAKENIKLGAEDEDDEDEDDEDAAHHDDEDAEEGPAKKSKKQRAEEELKAKFQPLTAYLKVTLAEHIDKAVLSSRLTTSPCALVAPQFGWSGNMERIMQSQAYVKQDDPMTKFYLSQKKTLEINPKHPVIIELLNKVDGGQADEGTADLAKILFDTATLRSGYTLRSPTEFAQRIERVLRANLGVDLEAQPDVQVEKLPLAKAPKAEAEHAEEAEEAEETHHDEL